MFTRVPRVALPLSRRVAQNTSALAAAPRFMSQPRRTFADQAAAAGDEAKSLRLNLVTPHATLVSGKVVDMVTLPGVGGYFGVAKDHVPTVTELKPGAITVAGEDGAAEHYFISGGFAFMHADSTLDVTGVEIVPIEQLDPNAVRSGLDEHTKNVASQDADVAARAAIGVEVYEGMTFALSEAGIKV